MIDNLRSLQILFEYRGDTLLADMPEQATGFLACIMAAAPSLIIDSPPSFSGIMIKRGEAGHEHKFIHHSEDPEKP